MKKLLFLFAAAAVFSCTKKDVAAPLAANTYFIRVAAIENAGTKSYTPVTQVKSGRVAVEFETAEVSDISEYRVEASSDGLNFKTVKVMAADQKTPNKLYRDTVVLQ